MKCREAASCMFHFVIYLFICLYIYLYFCLVGWIYLPPAPTLFNWCYGLAQATLV